MEEIKRKHRKAKSVAEIDAEIKALNEQRKKRIEKDQIEIGGKMQEKTGLQTWTEIEPVITKALELLRSDAAQTGQELG